MTIFAKARPSIGIWIATVAIAMISHVPVIHAQTWNWTNNSSSGIGWANSDNWLLDGASPPAGEFPNQAGITVNFTNNITGPRSVSNAGGNINNSSNTVGHVNIGDSDTTNKFTLNNGQGDGLVLDGAGSVATFTQTSTSVGDTINTNLLLASSLEITNESADRTLTFSNSRSISSSTTGTKTLTITNASVGNIAVNAVISDGDGTVFLAVEGGLTTLLGVNTYTGGTTISGGELRLGSPTTLQGATGDVNVSGGKLSSSSLEANTALGGTLNLSGTGVLEPSESGAGSITLSGGADFTMTGGTWNLNLGESFDSIIGMEDSTFTITGGTLALDNVSVGSYQIFTGFESGSYAADSLSFTGVDPNLVSFSVDGGIGLLTVVPEPQIVALAITGLLGLVLMRRRRTVRNT